MEARLTIKALTILLINLYFSAGEEESLGVCVDPDCSVPIAHGETIVKSSAFDKMTLAYSSGEKVVIYVRSCGPKAKYLGVEINGKRGYVPERHVKETATLSPKTQPAKKKFIEGAFSPDENSDTLENKEESSTTTHTSLPSDLTSSSETTTVVATQEESLLQEAVGSTATIQSTSSAALAVDVASPAKTIASSVGQISVDGVLSSAHSTVLDPSGVMPTKTEGMQITASSASNLEESVFSQQHTSTSSPLSSSFDSSFPDKLISSHASEMSRSTTGHEHRTTEAVSHSDSKYIVEDIVNTLVLTITKDGISKAVDTMTAHNTNIPDAAVENEEIDNVDIETELQNTLDILSKQGINTTDYLNQQLSDASAADNVQYNALSEDQAVKHFENLQNVPPTLMYMKYRYPGPPVVQQKNLESSQYSDSASHSHDQFSEYEELKTSSAVNQSPGQPLETSSQVDLSAGLDHLSSAHQVFGSPNEIFVTPQIDDNTFGTGYIASTETPQNFDSSIIYRANPIDKSADASHMAESQQSFDSSIIYKANPMDKSADASHMAESQQSFDSSIIYKANPMDKSVGASHMAESQQNFNPSIIYKANPMDKSVDSSSHMAESQQNFNPSIIYKANPMDISTISESGSLSDLQSSSNEPVINSHGLELNQHVAGIKELPVEDREDWVQIDQNTLLGNTLQPIIGHENDFPNAEDTKLPVTTNSEFEDNLQGVNSQENDLKLDVFDDGKGKDFNEEEDENENEEKDENENEEKDANENEENENEEKGDTADPYTSLEDNHVPPQRQILQDNTYGTSSADSESSTEPVAEESSFPDPDDETELEDSTGFFSLTSMQAIFLNSIASLRSMLDYAILLVPEPVYSYIDYSGISARAVVFTAIISFPCAFLFFAAYFIKERSKEQILMEELRDTEHKLYVAVTERDILRDETKNMKSQLSEVDSYLSEEKNLTTELQKRLQDMEFINRNVNSEHKASTDVIKELHARIDEYMEQVKDLKSSLSETQKQNDEENRLLLEAQNGILELEEENNKLKEELEELSEEKERNDAYYAEQEKQNKEKFTQFEETIKQLLSEAQDWNAKVQELNGLLQTETLSKEELQKLSEDKDSEIESLKTALSNIKLLENMKEDDDDKTFDEKVQAFMNVSSVQNKLKKVEEVVAALEDELKQEKGKGMQFKVELIEAQSEAERMNSYYNQALKEKEEFQQKLEFFKQYFKEKEMQMQKELGLQEAVRQRKEEDATHAERHIHLIEKENESYKYQVATLKQEIEETERTLKNQIATQEKKAHENWLAARSAERKAEELKQETGQLRQRLTLLEREQENWLNSSQSDIVRPVAQRMADVLDMSSSHDGSISSEFLPRPEDLSLPMRPGSRPMFPPPPPPGAHMPPPPFMPPFDPMMPLPPRAHPWRLMPDKHYDSDRRNTPSEFDGKKHHTPPFFENERRSLSPVDGNRSRGSSPPEVLPDFHNVPPPMHRHPDFPAPLPSSMFIHPMHRPFKGVPPSRTGNRPPGNNGTRQVIDRDSRRQHADEDV